MTTPSGETSGPGSSEHGQFDVLLAVLVCPMCRVHLELKSDGSGLKCAECKRVYPIRDGIPVMLVDQATIEPE